VIIDIQRLKEASKISFAEPLVFSQVVSFNTEVSTSIFNRQSVHAAMGSITNNSSSNYHTHLRTFTDTVNQAIKGSFPKEDSFRFKSVHALLLS
jgi:hypothetical protein